MGEEFDRKASDLLAQLRLQERKSTLSTLLGMRFGELPASVKARIEGADGAQIDAWFARLADATALPDVLPD